MAVIMPIDGLIAGRKDKSILSPNKPGQFRFKLSGAVRSIRSTDAIRSCWDRKVRAAKAAASRTRSSAVNPQVVIGSQHNDRATVDGRSAHRRSRQTAENSMWHRGPPVDRTLRTHHVAGRTNQ